MKKTLSIVLSLIFTVSALICVPVHAAGNDDGTDIPLIYIIGSGQEIYVTDEDGTQRTLYPVELPVDQFMQVAKDNIGVFVKALFTQKWTDFGNLIRDTISPLYHELALDENGEAPNGSTGRWSYSKETINTQKVNGKYPTQNFEFNYDWRMDPYKIADQLHQYIEDVLEVTGEKQVAIMGRCLGACIATAYMEKYDGEYVSDLVIYASALNGATICSKLFSGDLYLDADGIERYVNDIDINIEGLTKELVNSFVTVFNDTYGLDLACWAVNNVWENIYLDIMPQILIDSFGTFPGYWSMVSDRDYIRAKNNIFHNADMEKWAPFIDIIDNYHYNVQMKAPELFKDYESRGIIISNVTKYGYQAIPLSAPSDAISDSYCTVFDASMGAGSTSLFTTFSDEYVANAEANGTAKYISPDRQIDASTCLFPDRTWFIKNYKHKDFFGEVDPLLNSIVNGHGEFTVNSEERYPQFMVIDGFTPVPMTSENQNTTQRYESDFFASFKLVTEWFFSLIKNYFANINLK